MSTDLYDVLALASRYLFALLGVLIVLRAFFWLITDHSERKQQTRRLPNAGMIGEFVVLSGGRHLPEGATVAVPWEGILGSVRTADVVIPCEGVGRKHSSFLYVPEKGLLVHPCSGQEVLVNGVSLDCHSRPEDAPLTHGSFLQAGSALLRLRVFAGLDPAAGFSDSPVAPPVPVPMLQEPVFPPPQPYPAEGPYPSPAPQANDQPMFPPETMPGEFPPVTRQLPVPDAVPNPSADAAAPKTPDASSVSAPRRRRSDRWEVDWSE